MRSYATQKAESSRRRMQSQRERSPVPLVACFLLFLLLLADFFHPIAASHSHADINCSRRCVAENCNTIGIRYGKFCGVGWTGCPGEKPCDELDACCKAHDECVEKKVNHQRWESRTTKKQWCEVVDEEDTTCYSPLIVYSSAFLGLMSVPCHDKFKRCIEKVKKTNIVGFSKECPYETAMPIMIQGMDMAILFSQLGTQARKSEL